MEKIKAKKKVKARKLVIIQHKGKRYIFDDCSDSKEVWCERV